MFSLRFADGGTLRMGPRTRVMGVINVTPDSFSDGGIHLDPGAALESAEAMVAAGAEILDVGGESTRPGADPVSAEEEARRILPVIEGVQVTDEVAMKAGPDSGAVLIVHLVNHPPAGSGDTLVLPIGGQFSQQEKLPMS